MLDIKLIVQVNNASKNIPCLCKCMCLLVCFVCISIIRNNLVMLCRRMAAWCVCRKSGIYKYSFCFVCCSHSPSFFLLKEQAPLIDSDEFLPHSLASAMRWFLLPSEAQKCMKGKFRPTCIYEPPFFPRETHQYVCRRTRLKTGSIYGQYCNCPLQEKRHLINQDCRSYFKKQLGSLENELIKWKEEKRKNNEELISNKAGKYKEEEKCGIHVHYDTKEIMAHAMLHQNSN